MSYNGSAYALSVIVGSVLKLYCEYVHVQVCCLEHVQVNGGSDLPAVTDSDRDSPHSFALASSQLPDLDNLDRFRVVTSVISISSAILNP